MAIINKLKNYYLLPTSFSLKGPLMYVFTFNIVDYGHMREDKTDILFRDVAILIEIVSNAKYK